MKSFVKFGIKFRHCTQLRSYITHNNYGYWYYIFIKFHQNRLKHLEVINVQTYKITFHFSCGKLGVICRCKIKIKPNKNHNEHRYCCYMFPKFQQNRYLYLEGIEVQTNFHTIFIIHKLILIFELFNLFVNPKI